MEYICDKIIPIKFFENLNIYLKIRVVDGILGWFFCGYDIDIHQLNLGESKNLKFLDEIPFLKCFFWHLFSNECIIISSI